MGKISAIGLTGAYQDPVTFAYPLGNGIAGTCRA
jgi:hypothetical protein